MEDCNEVGAGAEEAEEAVEAARECTESAIAACKLELDEVRTGTRGPLVLELQASIPSDIGAGRLFAGGRVAVASEAGGESVAEDGEEVLGVGVRQERPVRRRVV